MCTCIIICIIICALCIHVQVCSALHRLVTYKMISNGDYELVRNVVSTVVHVCITYDHFVKENTTFV